MKKLPIHEAANCYRLMGEEELERLTEDIKENGLRDPITIGKLNGSEWLVDGRNRLNACERAGVEPRFETVGFDSEDEIRAFIRSKSERRDLSAGARAMAMAMLHPEPAKVRRKGAGLLDSKKQGFSDARLTQARQVLRYSREKAEKVRDGINGYSLDKALKEMEEEQAAAKSDENRFSTLEQQRPDLAQQVCEERLTLGEAYAAYEERKRDDERIEQEQRETILRVSEAAYRCTIGWSVPEFSEGVSKRLEEKDFRDEFKKFLRVDPEHLAAIEKGAKALRQMLEKYFTE